jgi:membrane associated rhomboid family serine protease
LSVNLILVLATAAISYYALQNKSIMERFILYPYNDIRAKKWYTIFTSGFLHADFNHLLFNMFTLFFLGGFCLGLFQYKYEEFGSLIYIIYYISAVGASSIPSFIKHKDDPGYRALGASGGVSAIIFFFILTGPWEMLLIFGIIPIPAIVLGVLYLVYESYMSKKGNDNIGHNAHLTGAIYGIVSYIVIFPELAAQFFGKFLAPFAQWLG